MMLRGHFPRDIEHYTHLTGLDLSTNELSGPLPFDIGDLLIPFVTKLDLTGNNFSGEIPKSFVNCSFLNVLKLDQNQLTGQIPSQISDLDRLKFFNVSKNQLSGLVLVFNKTTTKFTTMSFANNKELCGGSLEPCPK